MVRERRWVLGEDLLREWLRSELDEHGATSEEAMGEVEAAIERSHLFRREELIDRLGQRQPGTTFRHPLVGEYLASRHLREVFSGPDGERQGEYLALSREEEWSEVFYFMVDEMDSRTPLAELVRGLMELDSRQSRRVVAYAMGSKPAEMIPAEIRQAYSRARLWEDLARTPAGVESASTGVGGGDYGGE
jgi:hypothetical protein